MRVLLLAMMAATMLATSAQAADVAASHQSSVAGQAVRALPFPRTERAAAIWSERACWSQCGAYCAWGMASCLQRDAQGICLELTDKCDRACLRNCRTSGGPYLPDIFDF